MADSHAKSPWKKILWISGGIVAVLVGATIYAKTYPSPMEQDIAAIHAMGYPTSEAEIVALALQGGENADPIYQKFVTEYRKIADTQDFKRLTYSSNRNPISADLRAKLVEKFRYLLPPLIDGSKKPRWSPTAKKTEEDNYKADIWVRFDPVVEQDGFRLLMQTAIADMEARRYVQATDEFQAGQRMIGQMAIRPTASSFFDESLCDYVFLRSLSTVVHEDASPEVLKNIESLLNESPPLPDIRKVFYSQFVADVIDFRDRVKPEHGADLWRTVEDRFWARGQSQRLANALTHVYREAFEQMPRDPNDVDGMRRVFVDVGKKHSKDLILARAGVADETRFWVDRCDRWLEQVARRRVMLAGVRVLRLPSPSYPLPGTGEDVIDPFSGRPLVYEIFHGQFVVYSVGKNRVDDGGVEPSYGRPSDIVFRY